MKITGFRGAGLLAVATAALAISACSTLDFGPEPGSAAYEQTWCEDAASRAPVNGSAMNPPTPGSSAPPDNAQFSDPGNRAECTHAAARRAELAGVKGEQP
ncbi:hypothetical protein F3N42_05560 [Marinihelvus fidelis]|uniref:Lipoprotein n=1 Tax=Marinihelvus fidelis TaxID=2613842 RepID=A0A5N0TD51_9GAMM|nr:hypothetical protein [Marinihelvus fidelis]KAA9132681.1 hypothetical protein F3N42_05560 [Marinihelvus fidelis]